MIAAADGAAIKLNIHSRYLYQNELQGFAKIHIGGLRVLDEYPHYMPEYDSKVRVKDHLVKEESMSL